MTMIASTMSAVILAFCSGAVTVLAVLRLRAARLSPDAVERARYLEAHAVRLALAQHWARGGLLSGRAEPWRPVCTSAAIAALAVDDVGELLTLLGDQLALAGDDGELANCLTQARGELVASRSALPLELLTGRTRAGRPTWNATELGKRARECLDSGRQGAAAVLAARRAASLPPARPD